MSLETCLEHNCVVVYEPGRGRKGCPVCEMALELRDSANEIAELKEQVEMWRDRADELEAEE